MDLDTALPTPPTEEPKTPLPKKLIVLVGIILLLITLFSLYYFKIISFNQPTPKTPPPIASIPQSNEVPGLQKAKQLSTDYPQMIKMAFIQQQFQGTLKTVSENSWTIEAGGKSLTLTSQTNNKIRLVKQSKSASGSANLIAAKVIKPEEMNPGDLVLIDQVTNWQTGQSIVVSITVLLPQ